MYLFEVSHCKETRLLLKNETKEWREDEGPLEMSSQAKREGKLQTFYSPLASWASPYFQASI